VNFELIAVGHDVSCIAPAFQWAWLWLIFEIRLWTSRLHHAFRISSRSISGTPRTGHKNTLSYKHLQRIT